MALKQLEPIMEQIGKFNFYITPFPAMKAANMTGELTGVAGPIIGCILPLAGGVSSLGDIDVVKAAQALQYANIDGDKLERLSRKLILGGNVVVEYIDEETGKKEAERLTEDLANEIFCGEVQDMFVLCVHVIKINFGGFFEKLLNQFGAEGLPEQIANKQREIF